MATSIPSSDVPLMSPIARMQAPSPFGSGSILRFESPTGPDKPPRRPWERSQSPAYPSFLVAPDDDLQVGFSQCAVAARLPSPGVGARCARRTRPQRGRDSLYRIRLHRRFVARRFADPDHDAVLAPA